MTVNGRHPTRAAFGAGLVVLLPILVFGNQWYYEHFVYERRGSAVESTLATIPAVFGWRFTPRSGAFSFWSGDLVAIAILVVGVVLLVGLAARRASGFGLFAAVVGIVTACGYVAAIVRGWIVYGYLWGPRGDNIGFGRFWYPILSPSAYLIQWTLAVGAVAGLVAALLAGRANEPEVARAPDAGYAPARGDAPPPPPPAGTGYAPPTVPVAQTVPASPAAPVAPAAPDPNDGVG
jgi:hypothetical protein